MTFFTQYILHLSLLAFICISVLLLLCQRSALFLYPFVFFSVLDFMFHKRVILTTECHLLNDKAQLLPISSCAKLFLVLKQSFFLTDTLLPPSIPFSNPHIPLGPVTSLTFICINYKMELLHRKLFNFKESQHQTNILVIWTTDIKYLCFMQCFVSLLQYKNSQHS